MMKESATISFRDAETYDEAMVVVRHDESMVGLCLSLRSNDDIEVFMRKQDARSLIEALRQAVE